jgi:hypothetical protein
VNSLQFDVRYLETNAERFNEPGTPIVKSARILTEALLQFQGRRLNIKENTDSNNQHYVNYKF